MKPKDSSSSPKALLMMGNNVWGLQQIGKPLSFSLAPLWGLLILNTHQVAIAQVIPNSTIIPDSTLGGERAIVVPRGFRDLIQGGAIRDDKAFFSFQEFNIDSGQQVYFDQPGNVTKIFSRVTGENPSLINGLLGVTGSADLIFSNPNGIVFGAGASLDIAGSLSVNTGVGFTVEQLSDRAIEPSSLLKINLEPGLQRAIPESKISTLAHLSVGGDLNFEADVLEIQGSLSAGGNINFEGSDILVRDTLETATTLDAENVAIAGDRVELSLYRHSNSGIFARGAIAITGREEVLLQGKMRASSQDNDSDILPLPGHSDNEVAPPEKMDGMGQISFVGAKIVLQDDAESATIVEADADLTLAGNSEILLNQHPDSKVSVGGSIVITQRIPLPESLEEMQGEAIAAPDFDNNRSLNSEPLNSESMFLELQGRLEAGENIEISSSEILIQDTSEGTTAIAAAGNITIEGDRVEILLHRNPESEIVAEGAISTIGYEEVVIQGRIEAIEKEGIPGDDFNNLTIDNLLEEVVSGIFLKSEENIRLSQATLNVLANSGSVTLEAPTLQISASEVGAESIELNADTIEIGEKSELHSFDFNSPSVGGIDIKANQSANIDRADIIAQTSQSNIHIASPRITIKFGTIENQSLQSNLEPKISFQGSSLSAQASEIETIAANEGTVSDIEFNVNERIEFSEGTSVVAQGNIDIRTQSLVSPPDAIQSKSGAVNIEILPTPVLPPLEEIPPIPTFSPNQSIEEAIIEPASPEFEIDFNESEQQLESNDEPDIPRQNGCVAKDDQGLFILKQGQRNIYLPKDIPANFSSLNPSSPPTASIASIDAREAKGAYRLSDGRVVLSRPCVASASLEGGARA
ncbi:MAG: filamentous hemagglutinin N-terminal domain-containing protein [Cyanobacteria bacterium SBLK]|nr:filamentous hemagglutinin N-terminal domain-containing protein [Cyanobacteria bacterium SBLK]